MFSKFLPTVDSWQSPDFFMVEIWELSWSIPMISSSFLAEIPIPLDEKIHFFRSRVFMWHWPFFRNHHGFSWTLHHFTIQNRITPNFLKWHVHVSWWKILWKHNFSWWNHQFLDDEMVWHGPFSIVGPPGGAGASAVGGPSSAERAERLSAGNVGKNVVRSGDWSMNQIHLDGYMVYKVYTTYKNGDLGI